MPPPPQRAEARDRTVHVLRFGMTKLLNYLHDPLHHSPFSIQPWPVASLRLGALCCGGLFHEWSCFGDQVKERRPNVHRLGGRLVHRGRRDWFPGWQSPRRRRVFGRSGIRQCPLCVRFSPHTVTRMRRPQFSLRALLVAMLVVAAFFGGMALQRSLDTPVPMPMLRDPASSIGLEYIELPDGSHWFRPTAAPE